MKKLLLMVASAAILFSCSKDSGIENVAQDEATKAPKVINITVSLCVIGSEPFWEVDFTSENMREPIGQDVELSFWVDLIPAGGYGITETIGYWPYPSGTNPSWVHNYYEPLDFNWYDECFYMSGTIEHFKKRLASGDCLSLDNLGFTFKDRNGNEDGGMICSGNNQTMSFAFGNNIYHIKMGGSIVIP